MEPVPQCLAKKEGFDVFVSDMSAIKDKYKKLLDDHAIEWEESQHTEEKILSADEIIKEPGYTQEAPMVKTAMQTGHTHHQRDRVCRTLHQLEDDMHHRLERQDNNDVAHLSYLQDGRLRRGLGGQHRTLACTAGG